MVYCNVCTRKLFVITDCEGTFNLSTCIYNSNLVVNLLSMENIRNVSKDSKSFYCANCGSKIENDRVFLQCDHSKVYDVISNFKILTSKIILTSKFVIAGVTKIACNKQLLLHKDCVDSVIELFGLQEDQYTLSEVTLVR